MINNYTSLYIVRHGQSEGNEKGILQGQLDFLLTKHGEEQATTLAKELQHIHFDMVFASDLLRAKRTAEIIALEHQLVVKTTQALRERHYGKFQGLGKGGFTHEVGTLFDKWNALTDKEWLAHKMDKTVESGEEMLSRLLLFIREIAVGHPGKNVLVVSHGDMMRNLLVHLGWANHLELRGRTISNTAYIKLKTDGTDFVIEQVKGVNKNLTNKFTWTDK